VAEQASHCKDDPAATLFFKSFQDILGNSQGEMGRATAKVPKQIEKPEVKVAALHVDAPEFASGFKFSEAPPSDAVAAAPRLGAAPEVPFKSTLNPFAEEFKMTAVKKPKAVLNVEAREFTFAKGPAAAVAATPRFGAGMMSSGLNPNAKPFVNTRTARYSPEVLAAMDLSSLYELSLKIFKKRHLCGKCYPANI